MADPLNETRELIPHARREKSAAGFLRDALHGAQSW